MADGNLEELEWFLFNVHKQTRCFNHTDLIVLHSSAFVTTCGSLCSCNSGVLVCCPVPQLVKT